MPGDSDQNQRAPGPAIPLWMGALLLLVSLGVCLGLAETAVWLYSRHENVYDIEMWRYASTVKMPDPHPKRVFRHQPNKDTSLYGVPVKTNNEGFRNNRDFDKKRVPGVKRVLLLGDSITFGWGVRVEEALGGRLPALLGGEDKVEVINTGVGNYCTTQEVQTLESQGLAYTPDWIVIGYTTNDAEVIPTFNPGSLWSKSRLTVLLWSRLDRLSRMVGLDKDWKSYYIDLYRPDAPGWIATQAALKRLGEISHLTGVPVLLFQIPELHQLGSDYPFRHEHQLVREVAEGAGIHVVDLVDTFPADNPMGLWVSAEDAHPNSEGHRLLAEGIAAALMENGWTK